VAFTLINKVLDDFSLKFPSTAWNTLTVAQSQAGFPELKELLVKYQDPHSADSLMKVQKELDETKIILVRGGHSPGFSLFGIMFSPLFVKYTNLVWSNWFYFSVIYPA
jgi:hypothetical protein